MRPTRCNVTQFIYFCECSTCLRRFLRPSSGAQTVYTASDILSNLYCYLPLLWKRWNISSTTSLTRFDKSDKVPDAVYTVWALDDGRRNRLKYVEHFTKINKLCNVASCSLHLKIRLRYTDPWTSKLKIVGYIKCLKTNKCTSVLLWKFFI